MPPRPGAASTTLAFTYAIPSWVLPSVQVTRNPVSSNERSVSGEPMAYACVNASSASRSDANVRMGIDGLPDQVMVTERIDGREEPTGLDCVVRAVVTIDRPG